MCDPLVSLTELSRLLRMPRAWLLAEAEAGRIPSLRVSKRFWFNPAAVKKALGERAAAGRETVRA